MNVEKKDPKIKSYIKKFTSEEASLKKIPFYLFLVGVLIVILIVKINETNKYLKIISESNNPSIEINTKDDNYDEVLNIYTESEKTPEEILPNPYDEIVTQPSKGTTEEEVKPSTSTNNKQKYVINTSSKKIHLPECSFVGRTKEENKKTVELTKDELNNYLQNGHEFCKTCGG